jgi:O-antigen/teichoic acid export membrane protein
VANTRLLCSLALVILVGGGVLSGADFFAAPWLSRVFHLPHRYQLDAIFLLRTFGILVTVSMLVGLITSLLQAHQRFGLTSKMRVASYLAWAGGLYLTVVEHAGLKGVALSLIAEQLIAALVLPATARHLTRSSFGLLSWAELRPILRFGGSVQARGLTSLVNTQFYAIIIGAVLPVAFVGLYNAGANPATQLFYVSLAAVSPIWTHLARVFSESGEAAARVEMARAQRLWATAISGFAAAEVGASFFAVEAWLGHRFETSAWVTVLLLGAYGFTLLASVLTYYTIAIGRPGIQVRAGVLGMIANVVLTVPLAFLGAAGRRRHSCRPDRERRVRPPAGTAGPRRRHPQLPAGHPRPALRTLRCRHRGAGAGDRPDRAGRSSRARHLRPARRGGARHLRRERPRRPTHRRGGPHGRLRAVAARSHGRHATGLTTSTRPPPARRKG